jgi:16S rRNA (guanine(966)-N(2))-methyltransferase RsmD
MTPLRVTGGESKGRRLRTPKSIRPTQGMVKEAIFNLVATRIEDARVVDLFAGSGALGIEALSRGAAYVTFVDRVPRGLAILRQNLDELGFKSRASVVRAEVGRWLESAPDEIKEADLVFLDPPYGDPVFERSLKALDRAPGDATVVAEYSRHQSLPRLERLRVERERRYGDTMVAVLES